MADSSTKKYRADNFVLLRVLRGSHFRTVGLIALLGVFFFQAALASPRNSVTFDEQYHVTLGYAYLKTGDLRLHRNQSPPLFEIVANLPLLLRSDLALPLDHPAYALWGDVYLFSDVFLWHANADAQGIVHSGRLVTAGFGVLLGLLLFVWGRQLYGEKAGWLAVLLFAFDPNFVANAIATLDLGLAFFVALAAWRLWHYLRRPTRLNVLLAGLALGAALATKFIAVMLLPAFSLILLIWPLLPRECSVITPAIEIAATKGAKPAGAGLASVGAGRLRAVVGAISNRQPGPTWKYRILSPIKTPRHTDNLVSWCLGGEYLRRALALAAMLASAWLVVWAAYGFQFGPVNGVGLPVPAPTYIESFLGMAAKSGEGRMNFLDDQTSLTGWPHYFVAALVYKTPMPTLLLTLAALLRWRWKREWRESSILIVPALILFAAASIGRLQLGYRYILPVMPFVLLIAARTVTLAWPRRTTWLLVGLVGWLVVGTLSIFPHYLSYFNAVAGGPVNGYAHLVDSNVDWGQDLPALKDWIDAHRPANLHLGYFGTAYPDRYGVQATSLPGFSLNAYGHEVDGFTSHAIEPGVYAISATLLRIGLVFDRFDIYAAFRSMTPVDRAGYSILIYEVSDPPDAEIDRAVIVGPRAASVPPDALGRRSDHPLRARWCAWPECFVFVPGAARYVVRDFIPFAPDLAEQARERATPLDTLRIDDQDFAVYELDASAIVGSKLAELRNAPVESPDGAPLTFPIDFDNGLSLVGYEVTGFDVLTYWQVRDRVTPPMTIFVHLLDAQGDIRGQHDGFGAALTTLQPGDVVIQRQPLTVAADAAPGNYRLQVGLYNPVTLDRFAARSSGMPPIDRVLLSTLEVELP